jgi:hypothetical protein
MSWTTLSRADLVDPVTTFTYTNHNGELGYTITNPRPGQFACLDCYEPTGTDGLIWVGPTAEAYVVSSVLGAVHFGVPTPEGLVGTVDTFAPFHQNPTINGVVMEVYVFHDEPWSMTCTMDFLTCQTVENDGTYLIREFHWSDGSIDRFEYKYIHAPEPGSLLLLGTTALFTATWVRKRRASPGRRVVRSIAHN